MIILKVFNAGGGGGMLPLILTKERILCYIQEEVISHVHPFVFNTWLHIISLHIAFLSYNNYPTCMRRGKIISRVVVVMDTKIAKSGDLGT